MSLYGQVTQSAASISSCTLPKNNYASNRVVQDSADDVTQMASPAIILRNQGANTLSQPTIAQ